MRCVDDEDEDMRLRLRLTMDWRQRKKDVCVCTRWDNEMRQLDWFGLVRYFYMAFRKATQQVRITMRGVDTLFVGVVVVGRSVRFGKHNTPSVLHAGD